MASCCICLASVKQQFSGTDDRIIQACIRQKLNNADKTYHKKSTSQPQAVGAAQPEVDIADDTCVNDYA
jgi:hypothetical protein